MKKYPLYSLSKPYSKTDSAENKPSSGFTSIRALLISLAKGGGSTRYIDRKFFLNAANGTAEFSIPFLFYTSRSESMPVWSSPLAGNASNHMCSIDFMAARKLHLMNADKSAMGKEIFHYKPQYFITSKIKKR